MKKFNIKVNGTAYEVEVEELGSCGCGPAPKAAPPAPKAAPAPAAPAPAPAAPAPAAGPSVSAGAGETPVAAPMPGKVLDVKVSVGQSVTEGQVVLILEAMKMQNEIPAPCAGTVKAINVSAGGTVNAGDQMIIIG